MQRYVISGVSRSLRDRQGMAAIRSHFVIAATQPTKKPPPNGEGFPIQLI